MRYEDACGIHQDDADRRRAGHPADLRCGVAVSEGDQAAVQFRQIVAILLLVVVCFVIGLIVRTGPGLRAKNAFERAILEKLPGYTFLRGLAKRVTGDSEERTMEPCLAEIEEALVPAFIVEELEDGQYTVLVPSAPTPLAGSIYILPPERVHPVDISFTKAISVFSKWGTGAGEFNEAAALDRTTGSSGSHWRPASYRILKPKGVLLMSFRPSG